MKKSKSVEQAELPAASSEPAESAPASPWTTAMWSINDGPNLSGAVVEVQVQFTASREGLEAAFAQASQRIAQEIVNLEAKVRASAAYKEWRTRFDRHAETHAVNETHLASVRSALDSIADATDKLQAAKLAAENEAVGQQLRQSLEAMRIAEIDSARAVQIECARVAEQRFKEIANGLQAEHDECSRLLLEGTQHLERVLAFNNYRSYLGTSMWIQVEARRLAFKLLGKLPLTPDYEPPRTSQPATMPLAAAPGYAVGMQALYAQQKSA